MSFERIATREANKSVFFRARIGAVVSKGGRVLSVGCNEIRGYKTRTKKKWFDSVHAEQKAILELLMKGRQHDLVRATIFVSRITRDGELALAKPCPICQELIKAVGIKRVYYTTTSGTESYDV